MQMRSLTYLMVIATTLSAAACGGGSSGDSTTTTTGTTSTTAVDSTGDTVPADLAISSPTSATTASSSLSAKGLSKAAAANFKDKKEAIGALIAGTGECSFTMQMPTPTKPNCYGPTLNYCNHPNATSSDADCIPPVQGQGGPPSSSADDGQLPQGDLGLWSASEGDQACAAAQMNYLVDNVASMVDNMVNMAAAVACAGEKGKVTLPVAGASTDLKELLAAQVKITGLTFNSAALARLTDASDGNPVYKYSLNMTMQFPGETSGNTGTITLTHIPTKTDKTTYRGKLRATLASATGADNNCQKGTQGHLKAIEISYDKSGSTLKSDMHASPFCGQTASPPTPLDPSDKVSASNTDGWGGNWTYGRFNINTSTGDGTVAYAWQAGQGDGFSRVFNMTTTANADKSASGTAYFGFGPDIATAEGRGTIKGFFCNWAGPGNQKSPNSTTTANALAQKQTMSRTATGTKFTSDASGTFLSFAPTNDCNVAASSATRYYAPTDAQSQSFPADGATTGVQTADNNKLTSTTSVTNNLINVTAVSFTQPTAPTTTDL